MSNQFEEESDIALDEALERPSMYNVLLLNDNFTPFDFVMAVLIKVFKKTPEEAEDITLNVHKNGKGICGTYTKEIADQKQKKVMELAKSKQHPLRCVVEEAPSSDPRSKLKM